MRYLHLISAFAAEPWALQRDKLHAMSSFLAFKAAGGDLSADEVQARIDGRREAAVAKRAGDIAVLPVVGVITQRIGMMEEVSGGASTDALGAQLRGALNDEAVKAVVLDIDSPGGGVFGVQELGAMILANRGGKPIIAQVNSRCASAAYWLASQADEIVVTPSGEAGSIGVYCVHDDITQMLADAGIKPTIVEAGEFKTELSGLKPLTEEARAALQKRVDFSYNQFVTAVAAGRGVSTEKVLERFGQGRMFDAPELVKRGMADRIGTLDETLVRLGAAPVRGQAGAQMRQAFAAGETPAPKLIEEHLRDGGFPNALATAFVSVGKSAFRQGDPGDEANRKAVAALERLGAELDRFSLPSLS